MSEPSFIKNLNHKTVQLVNKMVSLPTRSLNPPPHPWGDLVFCPHLLPCPPCVVEKRVVGLVVSASYGEFIEQTVTETCTFQHTRKFPMTSVLGQRFIPFYIIQCVCGSNPISIWRLLSEDATTSLSLSR